MKGFAIHKPLRLAAAVSSLWLVGSRISLAAIYDGTYAGVSTIGAYTHTETDVVSGLNVTGAHDFTGPTSGSFDWTGTITLTSPDSGTISGGGTIDNNGIRPFVLTSGGFYRSAPDVFTLYWGGTDSLYGPIGGVATLDVPEPATWALMLGGFAAVGLGLRRGRFAALRSAAARATAV